MLKKEVNNAINKKQETMKPLLFITFILLLLLLPVFALVSSHVKKFSYLSAFLLLLISFVGFYYYANSLWLNTLVIRRKLQKQGIKGPRPSFLYGNVEEMQRIQTLAMKTANFGEFIAHDYTSTLFPYFEKWRKDYGSIYTYSTGKKQHLYVNNPELVKSMNQNVSTSLGKPSYVTKRLAPMLGNGILRSNGCLWSQQRKIVAPEFYMDKVKGLLGVMLESSEPLISKWEACIDAEICGETKMAEISVGEDLREMSGDVISRACFGSSYVKGKNIFSKLRSLQKIIANQSVLFGSSSLRVGNFLPSKQQKEIQNLEKEIEFLIWETVLKRSEECQEAPSSEKDLLQLILEGAINNVGKESSRNFIVDNCKNIYFAGHESTAVAASWCLMLLALHPEWQDRIRDETAQVCPNGIPDAESLSKLKTVTMVINEVLRLYPPAAFVSREALEDTKIGHISVPKGVCIWTLIPTLHRDPEIWGADANEFKPERFENGINSACKVPQVYIPFGVGPRLCLGRNFAMVQLKVVLTLIISKFTFALSPNYRHSPTYHMIVEPGQGVTILIQRCR